MPSGKIPGDTKGAPGISPGRVSKLTGLFTFLILFGVDLIEPCLDWIGVVIPVQEAEHLLEGICIAFFLGCVVFGIMDESLPSFHSGGCLLVFKNGSDLGCVVFGILFEMKALGCEAVPESDAATAVEFGIHDHGYVTGDMYSLTVAG
jgi:hypothetical protein